MAMRTTRTSVTFRRPFLLPGLDDEQPAGVYEIETDEERVEGLSFSAYRRVETWIHLHPKTANPTLTQTMKVDADELQALLRRDQAEAEDTAPEDTGPRPAN